MLRRLAAIEANARQYVPAANKPWEAKFRGVFIVKDGYMDTSGLTAPGLGQLDSTAEARRHRGLARAASRLWLYFSLELECSSR